MPRSCVPAWAPAGESGLSQMYFFRVGFYVESWGLIQDAAV